MNHYDHAHNLARALKGSQEYRELLDARDQLSADSKNKEMLLEFRKLQWEAEKAQVFQQEIDEITTRRMEQLADLVNANPAIQKYLMAEYRFGQIMTDIQKILTESLSDWFQSMSEFTGEQE